MGVTPFQVEAWTEYAVGLVILFARILYRSINASQDWEGDDYFSVAAVAFWTVCGVLSTVYTRRKKLID